MAENLKLENFDPRTTTLRQFIQKYSETGWSLSQPKFVSKDGKKSLWGASLRTRSGVKDMLDRPIIELLSKDFIGEGGGMEKALKDDVKENAFNTLRQQLTAVYDNTIRQVERLDGIDKDSLVNPANQIVIKDPSKLTGKKTDRYRFEVLKMGEWYAAAMEHVQKNPQDRTAINAFIFGINTGLRPEEYTALDRNNFENPRTGQTRLPPSLAKGKADVPYLQGIINKTNTRLDAPLTSHVMSLIAEQGEINKELRQKHGARTPYLFSMYDGKTVRPVTTKDVTDVIRKIKVPGIMLERMPDGTEKPLDNLSESKDSRRINATIYEIIGVSEDTAGQLKGRGVTKQGGHREGTYRGLPNGVYPGDHILATQQFEEFINTAFADELNYRGHLSSGGTVPLTIVPTAIKYVDGRPQLPAMGLPPKTAQFDDPISQPTQGREYGAIEGGEGTINESDFLASSQPDPVSDDPVVRSADMPDEGKTALQQLLSRGRNLSKTITGLGIGGLGVYGIFGEGQKAYADVKEATGSEALGTAAGIARGAYEALEPLPLGFMRPQPVGEGSELIPNYEARVEEQMSRIRQYDERKNEKEPGVEVELFTRDDPRFLTGE